MATVRVRSMGLGCGVGEGGGSGGVESEEVIGREFRAWSRVLKGRICRGYGQSVLQGQRVLLTDLNEYIIHYAISYSLARSWTSRSNAMTTRPVVWW